MNVICVPRFFDAHVHLRQDALLHEVIAPTAETCAYGLVMPNIKMPFPVPGRETPPPVRLDGDVAWYRNMIDAVTHEVSPAYCKKFKPLMTFALTDETTPNNIAIALAMGAVAAKVYPIGATTNSSWGVSDFMCDRFFENCEALEKHGGVLCLHGEDPTAYCADREEKFLPTLIYLAGRFPKLRIVLEHVSTAAAVKVVKWLPATVSATVTVHHLLYTGDDVRGGVTRPHLSCKPEIKRPEDRDAIQRVVLEGDSKFFFGSDSAPHDVSTKECAGCASGVFSAPVAAPLLAQFFSTHELQSRMEDFTSGFACKFYDVRAPDETITIANEVWFVPTCYGSVVPLAAGERLVWRLIRS